MRTITGIRGFRVPQGASFNTRQSFEMPHGRSATQRTVPPCFPSEKGGGGSSLFFSLSSTYFLLIFPSLFSLPPMFRPFPPSGTSTKRNIQTVASTDGWVNWRND